MVSISYAPKGTQLVSYQSVRRRRCGGDDEDHEGTGNRRWHHLRRVGRRSLAVQLRERGAAEPQSASRWGADGQPIAKPGVPADEAGHCFY